MGFCALGLGFMFQFEQHRLGLWDLSWDLTKTISWEMGLGPPLHDPLTCEGLRVAKICFFKQRQIEIVSNTQV